LDKQGHENPYEIFCGWLAPFMRARSMLTESGDVNFYSQSSEDSNGERENYALTKALQTKKQCGCVRGVSSKLT
jgi:hypothetical protein